MSSDRRSGRLITIDSAASGLVATQPITAADY
jgi:hypothetical protein